MEKGLEYILTNCYKAAMISYIEAHPDDFDALIKLAVLDKQPYSRRAAWLLWSCMEENDPRLRGHIHRLIDAIPSKSDEQQRELFIVLQKMELEEGSEGILFDICVNVWEKVHKMPSVRFNAFKLIAKIARRHAELSKEISYLIQDQYLDSLSPAAGKSIIKMANTLTKKPD